MCGIVGIFDPQSGREIDRGVLDRMNERQRHRGPDEEGIHVEPGLGLGHRRLSIIDLKSGQQPLYNEDRSVVVVYNGEIYNFKELRDELTKAGAHFRTHCDTEVIVHGWQHWGEACVQRFRGMFAFALWDRRSQTLFLARDRLGIKPLYHARLPDGTFLFASELKGILEYPDFSKVIDPLAVEEYFAYGYVPEPRTIFGQAQKLPPGHTLTLKRGADVPSSKVYWDVSFEPVPSNDCREVKAELLSRVRDAVDIRMIAEVPLGAFLSGGVDSSAVVATMAGVSAEPVNTCSISFGDPKFNEIQFANQVAEQYKTAHRVEQVESEDYSLVDTLASLYDEPFADSSALPTYRVCELARREVTVALSGDGGDENFAGYRRYRWHLQEEKIRSILPQQLRRPLFGALGRCYPKADWAPRVFRAKSTLEALARDSVEGYFHSVSVVPDALRSRLFSPEFRNRLQGYNAVEVLKKHAANGPTGEPLSRIQYLDLKTYLPGDILTKVDRASMAHSLEVRVPLLDHHLVEWVAGLPPELKYRSGEGKYVLKKAFEKHLPRNVLYRPKMGFAVPLASWFRGALRERVRSIAVDSTLAESAIFDRRYLNVLVDQHQRGIRDHSSVLWSLVMFDAFFRNSGIQA